jgi:hypothetical protein
MGRHLTPPARTSRHLCLLVALPLLISAVGCEMTKSSNPLSPSVAGPIPGVNISAPSVVQPSAGSAIAVDRQPITLTVTNASTSGVRPLKYAFEVAADADFTNKVFVRDGITPGEGHTSIALPDPLATGRHYYWRARAQDGANAGPYSSAADFNVFTPVVIAQPVPLSPIDNTVTTTLQPRFLWTNAPRTGPAGAIAYVIELSDTDSFVNKIVWYVDEQPNQTFLDAPQSGSYSTQYFWHVRAYDSSTTGPWSSTQAFQTLAKPAPTPTPTPTPSPSPTPSPVTSHVMCQSSANVSCAERVVYATSDEYPWLTDTFSSDDQASAASTELLLRTIWHLQLAGFQAGRQRNPSGLISGDKLTILIGGSWHAYDTMSLGYAGRATTVQFLEIGSPNYVPDSGIAD